MAIIVQKFGGTSVANPERIRNVAKRVAKNFDQGNDMVVILSAMAGVTDSLIHLAGQMADSPDRRELDVLLATGEQTTAALLAMTLKSMNYPAVSLLGYQAEVVTDHNYSNARILDIGASRIKEMLEKRNIVVVAGFQGTDAEGNITTLGRGGSDTSAVAIAAALKANVCEIYTDVDGVYTADPNVCSKARKLDKISCEEMLEMASLGAKVLHIRSVEFALKHNVTVYVRSSFNEEEGTMVINGDHDMERPVVSGITYSKNEARITLKKVPDQPGIAAKIFSPIADAKINVDMIIQNTRAEGQTDLTFTVPKTEFKKALDIERKVAEQIGAEQVLGDENIAKVSVTGIGMKSHSGVALKMFDCLAAENINITMISTSEIRISCVVEEKKAELAVRVLHTAFGLDREE
ncbi:aspartate kinase [Desulfonema magnum]|uniref:Aspartokinase n=1 Tax=Desulfonema magnum TaxID=45655 RepID=A0A975GLU2_9BACT|nr:aspartate kinase [Desulfonema magnum]QTA85950.1 Aspartate kinase [Desulfonema magnum]